MTLHDGAFPDEWCVHCDAVDCAEVNGSDVLAHEHIMKAAGADPRLDPKLNGWLLDVDYGDGSPVNDFCPDCRDS